MRCSSRFGIIPGVTDKGYITNSYHVHVSEQIDAFDKLKFESAVPAPAPWRRHQLRRGSRTCRITSRPLSRVMQYIYDNIMYAELNTKSDYCQVCGYDGEIEIVEDDGKLVWECPHCGNSRPGQDERGASHLRLHRHAVLESGPH